MRLLGKHRSRPAGGEVVLDPLQHVLTSRILGQADLAPNFVFKDTSPERAPLASISRRGSCAATVRIWLLRFRRLGRFDPEGQRALEFRHEHFPFPGDLPNARRNDLARRSFRVIRRTRALTVATMGSHMGFDAARKLPREGYHRTWPELLKMDDAIKARVSVLRDVPPGR